MPGLPASLQPFAKAVTPALLTVLAIVVQWIVTGEYDRAELATTLTGLLAAATAYLVPNGADVHHHEGSPPDTDEPLAGRGPSA